MSILGIRENPICAICLDGFKADERRWSHKGGEKHDPFHFQCIRDALQTDSRCPYDQKVITILKEKTSLAWIGRSISIFTGSMLVNAIAIGSLSIAVQKVSPCISPILQSLSTLGAKLALGGIFTGSYCLAIAGTTTLSLMTIIHVFAIEKDDRLIVLISSIAGIIIILSCLCFFHTPMIRFIRLMSTCP